MDRGHNARILECLETGRQRERVDQWEERKKRKEGGRKGRNERRNE